MALSEDEALSSLHHLNTVASVQSTQQGAVPGQQGKCIPLPYAGLKARSLFPTCCESAVQGTQQHQVQLYTKAANKPHSATKYILYQISKIQRII